MSKNNRQDMWENDYTNEGGKNDMCKKMQDLISYKEQFGQVIDIIESAKERAYRKVNEELILMYRDIGEFISIQSKKAEYGDAFVQKLADFLQKIIRI